MFREATVTGFFIFIPAKFISVFISFSLLSKNNFCQHFFMLYEAIIYMYDQATAGKA